MADIELSGLQAAIAAIVGSGSGLVTSALRIAKRFSILERKVEEIETELAQHKGSMSWVGPVLENIKHKLEAAQQASLQAQYGLESLRSKIEEADRRQRSSKQNLQQSLKDMNSGFKLELMSLKADVDEKLEQEIEKSQSRGVDSSVLEELRRRISELERKHEKLQEAQGAYLKAERFASFVEEQGRRWHELQRTLGRMEGHIKSNLSSGNLRRVSTPPLKGSGDSR